MGEKAVSRLSLSAACVLLLSGLGLPQVIEGAKEGAIVNSMCPVKTDEAVDPEVTLDYAGLKIGLCCNDCRRDFLSDPDAYAANLPEDVRAVLAERKAQDLHVLPTVTSEAQHPGPTGQDESAQETGALLYLGRFHPLVVHFPIALLFVAGLAEALGALRPRPVLFEGGRYCLALAAFSGLVSAFLGWLNASAGRYPTMVEGTLFYHRWLGVTTALVTLVAWFLGGRARHPDAAPKQRLRYRIALALAILLVGVTGHLGGIMVFGPDYYD